MRLRRWIFEFGLWATRILAAAVLCGEWDCINR